MGVRLAVGRGPPRRTPALARTAVPTFDLRQRQAGATHLPRPQPLQHGLASGREPVPGVQAFGEAELLQLAHVALERQLLPAQLGREFLGADLWMPCDQLEHHRRPRAVAARPVQPLELPGDLAELVLAQVGLRAQLDARVRARVTQLDLVYLAAVAPVEHREEILGRVEAGSPGLVPAERRPLDHLDAAHLEHADGRTQTAPGAHPRPLPAAEREVDPAVADGVEDSEREEHRAMISQHAVSRSVVPAALLTLGHLIQARSPAGSRAGGWSILIPSSLSWRSSTCAGAPVSGSAPLAAFGKAITSRIDSRPASRATMRSIPNAIPPCGGAPYVNASSRKPKRAFASSGPIPSASNTFCCTSGRLILIEPPPSSQPSRTTSYPRERQVAGSASRSPVGDVNGWCIASKRPSSSFHSNIGKSTTQKQSWPSGGPSATSGRSAPSTRATRAALPAPNRITSPSRASSACVVRATSSSPRNFAIGERHVPSASTTAQASPLAPSDFAFSSSLSMRLRGKSPRARRARTTPPPSTAPPKTLNCDPRKTSVRSTISTPSRRSGRSDPYLSITSSYVTRSSGVWISIPPAARNAWISGSQSDITSSSSTNAISTSSWVNSGWRSARKSSSRKQRGIWKERPRPPTNRCCLKSWGDRGSP